MALYVKMYGVYFNIFNNQFHFTTNLFIRCHWQVQNGHERLLLEEVLDYPSFALWHSKKFSMNRLQVFVFDSLP